MASSTDNGVEGGSILGTLEHLEGGGVLPVARGSAEVQASAEDAGSDSDEWETPPELFEAISRRYGPFDWDLAASAQNAKCTRFWDKEANALRQNWDDAHWRNAWVNPPYSRGMQGSFFQLARGTVILAKKRVTMLVQSTTEVAWFQEGLMAGADVALKQTVATGPLKGFVMLMEASSYMAYLHFLQGRVAFVNPVTKEVAGTGKTGSLVIHLRPRR